MDWLFAIDLPIYAAAAAAVFVASMVQGSTGLGFGMVAAPVMAVVDPVLVPGPLLFLAMLVSVLVAVREWRAIDKRGLAYALVGRIPASFVAGFTLAAIPVGLFGLVFGSLVLLAVALSVAGWMLVPSARNLVLAGVASGYMGTITSIGAPPMALVYQHGSGPQIRSTLGAYFVCGALISIIALAMFGRFGLFDLMVGLNLLPFLVAGFAVSNLVVRYVDKGHVRRVVLAFCTLSALALLAKSVL